MDSNLPHISEVQEAHLIDELGLTLKAFSQDVLVQNEALDLKLKQQEDRIMYLDRKLRQAARPHLAKTADAEQTHGKAFRNYLRAGDDEALRGLEVEHKGMSTQVSSEGGYLVDPQTASHIGSVLEEAASLRKLATIVEIDAGAYEVLVDHGDMGSGWAHESSDLGDTGTPKIDRISIPLHELSALPKASQRLLDDSAFDIETWLAGRIASKFARSEAAAFLKGDGQDKPRGVLAHEIVDNSIWQWGTLGSVPSGDANGFSSADSLIDLVYALGANYRANASFVMNSKTAGKVRKLKDNDGRFLWSDGLAAAEPARLLGYSVLIAEDMPDIAEGAHAIAFGDFAAGYTIVEKPELRVLRDPFSAKPHVIFYATKRVGGDVTDFAALKLMQFTAA